mgnify:CR=1 FL=1
MALAEVLQRMTRFDRCLVLVLALAAGLGAAITVAQHLQSGHMEFFRYMVDRLREFGAPHIKVFGGGGGTITPEEIEALMAYGVERIYHPHDGMEMGLAAMIDDLPLFSAVATKPQPAPAKQGPSKLEQRLSDLHPDELTQREALQMLYDLKALVQD